jgi:23S rRNA (cytidine1920-2'-O)/16S rRNA (cytidine1409-2'-O)-methyltransferase
LAATRTEAQDAIAAGRVLVGGAPATSAARLVLPGDALSLVGPPPRYVSRGGEKLAGALARFDMPVGGRRALDAGASTGGFTDCLLQHGAAHVVAVDVGRAQLHERLRGDDRITLLERTNVRSLTTDAIGGRVGVVVADLSFISLRTVFPVLLGDVAAPGADADVLVKPQFDAGGEDASRGEGVILYPAVWRRVLEEVASSIEGHQAVMIDAMASPLLGADGNAEFLLHVRPHADASDADATVLLNAAVAEAEAIGAA